MEGTLGGKKLADNVMLFDGGRQIALSELSQTGVNSGRVSYARTNWAGQVDLIVLNSGLAERCNLWPCGGEQFYE